MKQYLIHIDDDLDERYIIKELLEELNKKVEYFGFERGDEALEFLKIQKTPPCAIIVDLRMPGMDGLEIMKEIRNGVTFLDKTSLVCLSNLFHPQDRVLCHSLGFLIYNKPSSFQDFKRLILEILEHCFEPKRMEK